MKVHTVIGLVLISLALVKSDPTCTYKVAEDGKYTCTMTSSAATGKTEIQGDHISPKTNADVLRVITADKADQETIKLILGKFGNLEELKIQNGELTGVTSNDFGGSTCAKLKLLHLWKNKFNDIAKDTFYSCIIEEYDLSNNELTTLKSGALTTLLKHVKKLILANNKLDFATAGHTFEADLYPNLYYLDLSGNNLPNLPNTFYLPSQVITHLDLSKNQLTSFAETYFENNFLIENLYLNDNKLTTLTATFLKKLTKLKQFKIGKNLITTANLNVKAFEANTDLELVDLSENSIVTLDADLLKGLTKLKTLDLHNTKINATAALKTVFEAITSLEYIDISSNDLRSIDDLFTKNTNLLHLNLSSTGLTKFTDATLSANTKLVSFRFNANGITEFPEKLFEKTTAMKEIYGSSNKIKKLKASTFEKMTELEVLDLGENEIEAIEGTFFDKLSKLKIVKFKGRNKCIDEDFTDFKISDTATKDKFKKCFDNYNGAATIIISNVLLAFVVAMKFI